jgi:protein tyrosine/serine phosphatase
LRKNHDEAAEIETHAPGLVSLRIPVRNDHAPSDEQADKWLKLCATAGKELPIYVHCHEGHGRTSVFCALVRIAQGWDVERIFTEERGYGFDPVKLKEQSEFIRRFAEDVKAGRRGTYL